MEKIYKFIGRFEEQRVNDLGGDLVEINGETYKAEANQACGLTFKNESRTIYTTANMELFTNCEIDREDFAKSCADVFDKIWHGKIDPNNVKEFEINHNGQKYNILKYFGHRASFFNVETGATFYRLDCDEFATV